MDAATVFVTVSVEIGDVRDWQPATRGRQVIRRADGIVENGTNFIGTEQVIA
jgi:hypothetical protein